LLPARSDASHVPPVNGPGVVLAGSASRATNAQVAHWIAQQRPALRIDPLRLARGDAVVDEALAFARDHDAAVLIYATAQPDQVKAVQAELGGARAGELVEHALAGIDADTHLHVSFDVDFLDSQIAPGVGTPVRGGPTYREAHLALEMIEDTGALCSLDVLELNPARDVHNQTAELVVELIESLFGKSTL